MVPAMELAGDSAREPEMALEFEPVKDFGDFSGDCSVKSIGSKLSTLGFFFNG